MAAVINPVSVPTGAGSREVIDVGAAKLHLQKLENPQASLYQCSIRYGSQTVRSIFEKLAEQGKSSVYEEINLSDNIIGEEGARFLAEGLKGNTNIKTLLLPRTGINAAGFSALGGLLADSPALESAVLSGNICDAAGVQGRFADGLQKSSLKSIYLAACRLGDAGVKSLCEGPLKAHPSLQHVSLAYNRLEPTIVPSLAAMLSSNKVIEYIDLSGNSLGPEGAVALAQALTSNKTLKKLSLAQNMILLKGAMALSEHFLSPAGSALEFLDLRHNRVGYHGVRQIREKAGRPIDSEETNDGWLMVFGERQLYVSGC
jgi:Ran GTPase-activating protein (RanGAP) involved in mRNA processing and transport